MHAPAAPVVTHAWGTRSKQLPRPHRPPGQNFNNFQQPTCAHPPTCAPQALDLKPNYMRAWTNMGISLANLTDYDASARYYVRALALNPRAAAGEGAGRDGRRIGG